MTAKEMIKELLEFDSSSEVFILIEETEWKVKELDQSSSGCPYFVLEGVKRIPR